MQLDWNQVNQGGQLDQVLSSLPYPLDKGELVVHAQRAGADPQMITAIKQTLPDQTFNSAEDVKKCIPRH
jgi:hypothetical protein